MSKKLIFKFYNLKILINKYKIINTKMKKNQKMEGKEEKGPKINFWKSKKHTSLNAQRVP